MTSLKNINMLHTVGVNEKLWCIMEKIYMNFFKVLSISNLDPLHPSLENHIDHVRLEIFQLRSEAF